MKYIYYCPNCRKIMTAENKHVTDAHFCNTCKNECQQTGYTNEEWESLSKQARKDISTAIVKEYMPESKTNRFLKTFGMIVLLAVGIEGVTFLLGPSFTFVPVGIYFAYFYFRKDSKANTLRVKLKLDERFVNETVQK